MGLEKNIQLIDKKRRYFTQLGLQMRKALELHKEAGLWQRKEGKRDWGNVSEHCLVEVARADVLADELNLPEDIKEDLKTAAALHDFFKKGEKEIVIAGGLDWNSFEKASYESTHQMQEAGFSERIIHLANSIGHGSLLETESILKKENLSSEDVAYLVLHYIDDYTIGSDWVKPAGKSLSGKYENDLERRMNNNENNSRYSLLNEEGKIQLGGEKTFEAQRRIGHLVEQKLFSFLTQIGAKITDAKDLPQYIDQKIRNKIEKI